MENSDPADHIEDDGGKERIDVPKSDDNPTGKKAENKADTPQRAKTIPSE
jgi:hypothetical protein